MKMDVSHVIHYSCYVIWLPAWWALWLLWWPLTDATMFQCVYGYLQSVFFFLVLFHCCILLEIKLTTTTAIKQLIEHLPIWRILSRDLKLNDPGTVVIKQLIFEIWLRHWDNDYQSWKAYHILYWTKAGFLSFYIFCLSSGTTCNTAKSELQEQITYKLSLSV